MITARHSQIAKNELRKEGEIEPGENRNRTKSGQSLRIHATADLRPPEMNATQISHDHAANHDVMEMRDDEVSIVDMDIDRERSEEESR